jgi:cytochrome c oxidase subunit 2
MSDWYMAAQLKNFREGVRGAHPDDLHGSQMAQMAAILANERAIRDLVAYLNSL